MNNGLQDAFNLAWKLALVLQGKAPEPLLKSYSAERLEVDAHAQKQTDRMFSSFMVRSKIVKAARDMAIHALSVLPAVRRKAAKELSGISVDYGFAYREERKAERFLPAGCLRCGSRIPDCRLWLPARPEVRLFEILRKPGYAFFLFIEAGRLRSDRSAIRDLCGKIGHQFSECGSANIVLDEGLPDEVGVDWQVYVDFKGEFEKVTGAKHGSSILIRPDGYIAFHRRGFDAGKILEPIANWITRSAGLQEPGVVAPALGCVDA